MTLAEHARRELARIGEESSTVEKYVAVVEAFAAMGHSGGSAMIAANVVDKLIRYLPLAPLTDDPAEWVDRAEETGAENWWQNARDSRAISHDGGRTYWLVGDAGTTRTSESA